MIRTFLLKILLRWYIKRNREIVQLTDGEEFNFFKFGNPESTIKLLKSFMTAGTLWYWEAKSRDERNIIKGAVLMTKLLVDGHRACSSIDETNLSEEKKYQHWSKFKTKLKIIK